MSNSRQEFNNQQSRSGTRPRLRRSSIALMVGLAVGACGQPLEPGGSSLAVEGPPTGIAFDHGPSWQPDQSALDRALDRRRPRPTPVTIEFGGMPAPWGEPDWSHFDRATVREPAIEFGGMAAPLGEPNWSYFDSMTVPTQSVDDQAPGWPPNQRLLDGYLEERRRSGPR